MQQQTTIIPLSHGIGKPGQTIHACLQVMPDPVPCRNGFPPEQDWCHLATTCPCPASIQKTQGKNQAFPARWRQYGGITSGPLPHGGTPQSQGSGNTDFKQAIKGQKNCPPVALWSKSQDVQCCSSQMNDSFGVSDCLCRLRQS